MKLRKFLSFGLSFVLILSSLNMSFAETIGSLEELNIVTDEVVSHSAIVLSDTNVNIGIKSISSAEELKNISEGGSYVLTNDIDLSISGGWSPISLNDINLTIDGNGHTIKNFYRSSINVRNCGFFSTVRDSKINIKNLNLEITRLKTTYSGHCCIGGLIGYSANSDINIDNCHVTGNIEGVSYQSGDTEVGGFIGQVLTYSDSTKLNDVIIRNSSFNGSIIASDTADGFISYPLTGGLIGCANIYNIEMSGCTVESTLTATAKFNDGDSSISVGGLVGDCNCKYITFRDCKANSVINTNSIYTTPYSATSVGGLTGSVRNYNSIVVNSCATEGSMYSHNYRCYSGGLFGDASSGVNIVDCVTKMDMSAKTIEENYIGGYIGILDGKGTIEGGSYIPENKPFGNKEQEYEANVKISMSPSYDYMMGTTTDTSNCLIATLSPHLSNKSGITWKSSNPDIVGIVDTSYIDGTSSDSLLCNINCKAVGTSTITVTTADGASASCLVMVTEPKLEVVGTKIDATTKNGKINANDGDLFEGLDYCIKFNTPITLLDGSKITICKVDNINDGDVLLNNVKADRECYVDETDNTVLHIYQSYRSVESNPNIKNDYKSYINAHSIPLNADLCVLIDKTAIKAIDENYQFSGILDSSLRFATTSGIEFFKDTYNFVHSSDCFFNNNEEQHHNLSDKAASLLKENGISSKTIDNERYVKTWNGSCAGLTVLASLIKNGFISANDVVYNADTVFDFSAPRNNTDTNGLRDKIEYYYEFYNYLAKKTTRYKTNEYTNSDGKKVKVKNADTKYNEVLKEIVDRYSDVDVTKEYPTTKDIIIRIGFYGNNQLHGHTILPYNLIEEDNRYVVYCYDVNQLTTPLKLYISKDLGSISFSNSTYNDWVYIGYINLSEFLGYSLFATEIAEDMNNKDELAYFTINSGSNYCISDGDKTINVVNGKLSGDVDVIEYMDIEGGGTEFSADYILGLPQKNNYRIVCESGNANFEYIKGNMYLYLEAKNISEITVNDSNKVNIKGSEFEYNMSISSNLTDDSLLSIKGNSESYIDIDYIDNNANIKTDSLENTNAKLIVSGDITEIKEFAGGEEIKVSDNRFVETAESTSVETTTESTTDIIAETTVVTESSTESTTETIVTTGTTTVTTTEAITETTTIELKESTTEATTMARRPNSGGGGGSSRKAITTTTTTTEATSETTAEATTESAINSDIKITIGSKKVVIGDKTYNIDVAPYIQTSSNSTMVPLRFVALAIIGDDVEKADTSKLISWDANTKTATITVNNKSIEFTAGSDKMIVDGISTTMEYGVKAEIKDGRMFIPFRALGKALGVNVDWDADTKTAIYKTK